jgi:hypothetical protein
MRLSLPLLVEVLVYHVGEVSWRYKLGMRSAQSCLVLLIRAKACLADIEIWGVLIPELGVWNAKGYEGFAFGELTGGGHERALVINND